MACPAPRDNHVPPATSMINGSIFFLVAYPVFVLASAYYFHSNRRGSVLLRKRSAFLITMSCLGGLMTILAVCLRDVVGPSSFPCGVLYFLDLATLPLLMGPLIIRLAQFKVEVAIAKLARNTSAINGGDGGGEDTVGVPAPLPELGIMSSFVAYVEYGIKSIFKIKGSVELKKKSYRFIASNFFVVFWSVLLMLPFLIALLVFGLIESYACTGCELSESSDVFFLIALSVIFVVGVAHAFRMWQRTHDPLGLLPEFFLAWMLSIPFFLSGKVLHIIDPGNAQFGSRMMQWQWLSCIACIGVVFAQTWFAVFWAKRSHVSAAVLSTSVFEKNERMRDIFANASFLEVLHEHMVNELSVENLEFLQDVDAWKSSYESDKDNRQKIARRIYDVYLSRHAFVPINISSAHYSSAATAFSRGNVPVTIFDDAREEIVDLMVSDILPRFAKSPAMKAYASKRPRTTLRGTVQSKKKKANARLSDLTNAQLSPRATPAGVTFGSATATAAALSAGAAKPKTSVDGSPRVNKKNVATFLGDDVESGATSVMTESVSSPDTRTASEIGGADSRKGKVSDSEMSAG